MTDQTFTIRGTHIHVCGVAISPQEAELYLQQVLSSKLPPCKHYKLTVGGDGVVWAEALLEGIDPFRSSFARLPSRIIPYQPNSPVDYDELLSSQEVVSK